MLHGAPVEPHPILIFLPSSFAAAGVGILRLDESTLPLLLFLLRWCGRLLGRFDLVPSRVHSITFGFERTGAVAQDPIELLPPANIVPVVPGDQRKAFVLTLQAMRES